MTAEINPAYSTQIGAQLERVGNQQDLYYTYFSKRTAQKCRR
ncbi:hypothetical protein O9992_14720 [Vibrio lentus]|nr:hypothetical protein [Vibrio lentus]